MKGEFEFIEDIRKMFPSPQGVQGIGDDCAVIPQNDGFETLVSTDMLVEGSHFLTDDITPYQLGWKSAASNFSDIAAMGGSPLGSFLAIALPPSLSEKWREEFLRGYRAISFEYGFPLLGGDTTASKSGISICITVLGKCAAGQSIKRSGARVGDLICVTGTLGDSAAGLDAILNVIERTEDVRYLIERHYLPKPRLAEGQALAKSRGVHSMIDISDGIGSDILHIMEESGVGAEIVPESVPISPQLKKYSSARGIDIMKFAAAGGEDYELLFTVDEEGERALQVPHTVIGTINDSKIATFRNREENYLGFRHF